MERSNYALISALYASKTRGLYSDIYFPIIKYAIVKLYASQESKSQHYATLDVVQEVIHDLFGINIPSIVISMTLKKIDARPTSTIRLNLYSDNSFQIVSAMFDEDEHTYEEKEHEFNAHIIEIEAAFKHFLKVEQIPDEGITFIQFISDNTENLLSYFENNSEKSVEEKYSPIIFFLEFLNREHFNLFMVANQLFWSSIIVAFLESDRPMVESNEGGLPSEYYLDTSIMMGLLKLSTPEWETASKELCDIIKSSGAILKIHPLTVEEIKSILQTAEARNSVEGPLASAYARRNLNSVKLAQIRLNIVKLIGDEKVQIFPMPNRNEVNDAMCAYKGKSIVARLESFRKNKDLESVRADNFREVHDIFMDDYIRNQRKAKKGKDDIYFLTANKELIEFCHTQCHPNENYMISPCKVTLKLWMHNTKPSDISTCMLTETMARCLDSHRHHVRDKIQEVSAYFNAAEEKFDAELYKLLLNGLYRKAKTVIEAVEANPDDPKQYAKTLKEVLKAYDESFDSRSSELESKNEKLLEEMEKSKEEIQQLELESEQKSQKIGGLKSEKDALSEEYKQLKEKYEVLLKKEAEERERAEKERKEREHTDMVNRLYEKKSMLENNLFIYNSNLKPLMLSRAKSFKNWQPWGFHISSILLILGFVALVILEHKEVITIGNWIPYAAIITVACALFAAGIAINTNERRDRRKENAYRKWENCPNNSLYQDLMLKIENTKEDIKYVENQLEKL